MVNKFLFLSFLFLLSMMIFQPAIVSFAYGGIVDDWPDLISSHRDEAQSRKLVYCHVTPIEGNRVLGEIYLRDRLVISMVLPAGGYPVAERARLVSHRLNRYMDEQAYLEKVKVEKWDEEWVVTLGGSLVVTAATGSSQYFRMSRRELANRWADQLRTAFNELVGPGAQVVRGNPPVEKLKVVIPPWDDRYEPIIKGDKAYETGNYREAAKWYSLSLKEDPAGFDARYKLGMSLWKQGLLEEARDEFVGTLQVRPAYYPARLALDALDRE
jgi:tetratricopeptide (TPR) repeat protein